MSHKHEILLAGPSVRADRGDAVLMRDLLAVLVEGAQGAARFALEGRSTASGPPPWWSREVSRLALLPTDSAARVIIEAPTLREVDPQRFQQKDFLQEFDPDRSALEYFEDGLADALAGRADSDNFDDGLVQTYEDFEKLFRDGADKIEFLNGRCLAVERSGVDQVKRLRAQTPGPQAVRVAGKLDTIRHSDKQFVLLIEGSKRLRGVADDFAPLKQFIGRDVVVNGRAVFKPSGEPLRVEAGHIQPASDKDLAVFGRPPTSHSQPLDLRSLRRPQGPKTGINAIIGQWPGDETDEEVAEALKRL